MENKKIKLKKLVEAFDENAYTLKRIEEHNMITVPGINIQEDIINKVIQSVDKLNALLLSKGIKHKVKLDYDERGKRLLFKSDDITNEFGIFNNSLKTAMYHNFGGGGVTHTTHEEKFYFAPNIWFNLNLAYESLSGGSNGLSVILETGPNGWTSSDIFYDILKDNFKTISYKERFGEESEIIEEGKKEQVYSIEKSGRREPKVTTGSLEELTSHFSYTLLAGNSYNSKIDKNPKSVKSLVSNLNKAVDVLQRGSYNPEYYRLVPNPTDNEKTIAEGKKSKDVKPTAKELYRMFNKINKDVEEAGEKSEFVSLADVEYYADQIQNIYDLSDKECLSLAKEIAKMSKANEGYGRKDFKYPTGWAILPAGNIKLDTGDSTYFNVIENNSDDTGTLYLVKKSDSYHIFSSSEEYNQSKRTLANKSQACYHDQNLKTYVVVIEDVYPATLEGLAQIKSVVGKNSVPFSVFK